MMAIKLAVKLRPNTVGPSAPVMIVNGRMLDPNQIVNRSRDRPCRSSCGMMSMVRYSTALAIRAPPIREERQLESHVFVSRTIVAVVRDEDKG